MPKFVNLIAFLWKLISKEHEVVIMEFPDWVQVKMKILYEIAKATKNGVEPGANVSWFKTHDTTALRDGHPNTSLRNFGIAINTKLAFHFPKKSELCSL